MGLTGGALSVPQFDLEEQHREIAPEIDRALNETLDARRFILGPQVARLEEALADRLGVKHGIGCASGTDALLLPLRDIAQREGISGPMVAEDLDAGRPEVAIPTFTFFATAGAVWNAGLRPAFCDVDPASFNVTAETVSAACSRRTVAVVPVHLFGQMAPVEALRGAVGAGVFVLEDAAQATGAGRTVEGRDVLAGAAADACAFSFFPTKNLGGIGDGGLITTDDDALAERLRAWRVHGGREAYHHDVVGTNSRLDTVQAAVLLAKLPYLDGWLAARRRNAALYDELLAGLEQVRTPVVSVGNVHTYNQYTVRVDRRDELRASLTGSGIGTGVYYPIPLHLQPCFQPLGYAPGDFPVAERLAGEVLSLPIYPELGAERVRVVAEAIRRFYRA
jgi:dTDP-4-amino-4,6-dideoxygalactose transaminase